MFLLSPLAFCHVDAAKVGSVEHLRKHQYRVPAGQEPLGQSPLTVRLYASDHDAIKAMGKAGGPFVHAAVRKALQELMSQVTSGN